MNIADQLADAAQTRHLVLVEFYGDWSPHNEWLRPVVEEYASERGKVIEVLKVNIREEGALADSYRIESAPAFILFLRGRELWRQVGELTMDELQTVLEEF